MPASLPRRQCNLFILVMIGACMLFLQPGCSRFEDKRQKEVQCPKIEAELIETYNAYIDEKPGLSEPKILQQCRDALKICPALAVAYELMGMVELEGGNAKTALAHYIAALELEPDNEALLSEAQLLAFKVGLKYLYIDEARKVRSTPFVKLKLEEYAALADDVRLVWCEAYAASAIRSVDELTPIVVVDPSENRVRMIDSELAFSPPDLDAQLLSEAISNPDKALLKASFEYALRNAKVTSK